MNFFLDVNRREAGSGDGLAVAFFLLAGNVEADSFRQFREVGIENLARESENQVTASPVITRPSTSRLRKS